MTSDRLLQLLLLTFVAFACPSFSQDTINQIDNQGRKQGFWSKADSAGAKVYQGYFKDDIPTGSFTYYYPEGKIKAESFFYDHGRRAKSVAYFKNGRVMARGNYVDTKKDSIWRFYSENDTNLVAVENYNHGVLAGISTTFYPDGTISEKLEYKDGIKDGLWEQYFTNGSLKVKGSFKNGENVGPFTARYPGGKKMIAGQYTSGHQDGEWLYFNEDGKMVKKEMYKDGKLVKVVTGDE